MSIEVYPDQAFAFTPIGYLRNGIVRKFDLPHQPERNHVQGGRAVVELEPHLGFEKAVEDLAGFDRIWLVSWFHRNSTWKPKVQPPRGEGIKRGLFATRAPHRPNPIGISVVPLIKAEGLSVVVGSCDLLDSTPILDIKPYVPACDSYPDSKVGWLQRVEDGLIEPPRYSIRLTDQALEQEAWLRERGVQFIDRAIEILKRDPSTNRTRRIRQKGENLYRMGCAEWRLFFSRAGDDVVIEYFGPGYPIGDLKEPRHKVIRNRENQLEFVERFGER